MIIGKMNWFSILMYHFLLIDIALAGSLALAGPKSEPKESQVAATTVLKTAATTTPTSATSTTELPVKENEEKASKPENNAKQGETLEKPLPKKRGVLEELYHSQPMSFDENGYDENEEPTPEELFSAPRADPEERAFFRLNDRGDSGMMNDDGYFENDGRRKRTVMFDGLYNRPQEYSNPEVELTPEEVLALLNLLEQRRLYNTQMQSPWSDYDNTVDAIEADMRDADIYRARPGNSYGENFDTNFDNLEKIPAGMKRFMITRRRRSDYLGNPKLKVPVFRRAIL